MGKKATFLLFHFIFYIITFLLALIAIVAWLGQYVHPKDSWFVTFAALGIMPILAFNLISFLFWAIKRRWIAIFPLAVLILNYSYIFAIFQINPKSQDESRSSDLTVVSYNIHGFGQKDLKSMITNMSAYMKHENVDILCLQEFWVTDTYAIDSIHSSFVSFLPYRAAYPQECGTELVIFSKYPILASHLTSFKNTISSSLWADIDVKGRLVRVFNTHFQTTNLNQSQNELRRIRNNGISNLDSQYAADIVRERLYNNFCIRAEQAAVVRSIIDSTKTPVISCGDFNDTPNSYTYSLMKRGFTDSFVSCGNGYAYTYQPMFKILRIDYIFYSDAIKGVQYYSPYLSWSDHNPIFTRLSFE